MNETFVQWHEPWDSPSRPTQRSGEFQISRGVSGLNQKGRSEDGMKWGWWTLAADSTGSKRADKTVGLKACWLSWKRKGDSEQDEEPQMITPGPGKLREFTWLDFKIALDRQLHLTFHVAWFWRGISASVNLCLSRPLCVGPGNLFLQSPACRRGGVCPGAAPDSDDECWSLELMRFRSDFELWVDAVLG